MYIIPLLEGIFFVIVGMELLRNLLPPKETQAQVDISNRSLLNMYRPVIEISAPLMVVGGFARMYSAFAS